MLAKNSVRYCPSKDRNLIELNRYLYGDSHDRYGTSRGCGLLKDNQPREKGLCRVL